MGFARYFCVVPVCCGVCCWLLASADAIAQYTFKNLYPLSAPASWSVFDPVAAPGQVVGGIYDGSQTRNAVVWTSASAPVVLNPSGSSNCFVYATNGTQQAGEVETTPGPFGVDTHPHATLWNGSATSAVDLTPADLGFNESEIRGTNGAQQVGAAGSNAITFAVLWNGTAGSAVALKPTKLAIGACEALATDGQHQVGTGSDGLGSHALLWSGTADSAIDLTPPRFTDAEAVGIGGGQQVGDGAPFPASTHFRDAIVWSGTAQSAVDLTPATSPFTESYATATNGIEQVGYADIIDFSHGTRGPTHALLWRGTAESQIDLQGLAPADIVSSRADSIDAAGNVWGTAQDASGTYYAVEWVPTPEPDAVAVLIFLIPLYRSRATSVRRR